MSDAVCNVLIIISCYHLTAMLTRFTHLLSIFLSSVYLQTGENVCR